MIHSPPTGAVAKRPGTAIRWLAALLAATALILIAAPFPGSGNPASGTLTFVFEPGSATSTIRIQPVGNQKFVQVIVNGFSCLSMDRKTGEKNPSWNFTVDRKAWNNMVADGELLIEYVASETELRWLHYDASFHEYHRFPASVFPIELSADSHFPLVSAQRFRFPGEIIRNIFSLRKARFSGRLEGGADFKLSTNQGPFIGFHRIILRVRPVPPAPPAREVTIRDLVSHFFRKMLERPPKGWELQRYEKSWADREYWLFFFLEKLMYSREFQEKTFLSQERETGIRKLFRALFHRDPTPPELNYTYVTTLGSKLDMAARIFVEKYYGEMVENALREIRTNRP